MKKAQEQKDDQILLKLETFFKEKLMFPLNIQGINMIYHTDSNNLRKPQKKVEFNINIIAFSHLCKLFVLFFRFCSI